MENHPSSASSKVASANPQPGVQPSLKSLESRGLDSRYEESVPEEMANHREGRKDMRRRYDSGSNHRGEHIIDLSLDRGDLYSIKISRVFLSLFPNFTC